MVSILITVLVWYIYHRSWMINKKKENCTFSLCPCFGSLQAFVSLPVSLLIHSSVCVLSHVWLFAALWTVACQVPLSLGFSSQEYWSRLSFPSPGDLPDPGIEPKSPALAGGIFTSDPFRFNLKRSILTYKHLLSTLESWIKEKKVTNNYWEATGISLVVQWLFPVLPMKGAWVWFLVRKQDWYTTWPK